jgi:GNAT superfamily N-acetyltransferase
MQILHPTDSDWQLFLALARQEGWRVPAQELALFCGPLADCAFVLRADGEALGFVTAVAHEKSGWIGNLLVPARHRGRGYGGRLFSHACEVLDRRGARGLWLTASPLGRPIYEKQGFRVVDGVRRWTRRADAAVAEAGEEAGLEALLEADARAWGESRRSLLETLAAEGGRVVACGGTAALLQGGEGMRVVGPWASAELCPRENRRVLTALLAAARPGEELVADVLVSSPVAMLLTAAGFAPAGFNDLMLKGEAGGADLSRLVSLASLGSMG